MKSIPKQIDEAPVLFSRSKVIVEKDELEKLEQRSKLSMVHEKAVKELLTDSEAELRRIAELKERAEEEREQSRLQVVNAYSKSEEILTSTEKRAETILEEARKAYISAEMEKEKYQQKYEEQMDLNARYEQLKEKQADSEKKIEKLRGNIGRLRKEKQELQMNLEEIRKSVDDRIKAVTEPLQKQIEGLKESLRQAFRYIGSIVNAVNTLAYDRSLYKAELTPKQKNLIDAITDYASARVRDHGFEDVAEKMETQHGISEGIQNYLPKDKKRDRNVSR